MNKLDPELRDGLAILAFTALAIVPALGEAGCVFHWQLGLPLCVALALLGGTLAGALHEGELSWAGITTGVVMGVAMSLTTYFYVDHQLASRDHVYTTELFVPLCLSALPGLALYYVLKPVHPAELPQEKQQKPRRARA